MTHPAGYNPMRWKCEDRGCYNTIHRPKIEIFAECLPGKIGFTDVDATVELNGYFLFLEWKGDDVREIPTGQRIYFQRLTRISNRLKVVVVRGDAETMSCRAIKLIENGVIGDWEAMPITGLKDRIRSWAVRAAA